MKVILFGFGSIGKRHYANLKAQGLEVSVFDPNDAAFEDPSIQRVTEADPQGFDIAFICNPNHLHISTALECAKAGCHMFIEKPLSHNLEGIDELIQICEEKKLITMVGCNMRFHPCLQFIKSAIDAGKVGKVYGIDLEFGYYLPAWRPGQDYRNNYAAKKELGGGIILDDIHEFDLLMWLNNFEEVTDHTLLSSHSSDLEIETEDIAAGTFLFANGVLGTVRVDYLQQKYHRNCKVKGEKGNLVWDFNENKVILEQQETSEVLFETPDFDNNDMFVEELNYFLEKVKGAEYTFNDIQRQTQLLRYLL